MSGTSLPEVVISEDGTRAVTLLSIESERYRGDHRDGFYFDGTIRLRPREHPVHLQWFVSGTLAALWDHPKQVFRWGDDFADALPDLAKIAVALQLDEAPVPPVPPQGQYALRIEIMSPVVERVKSAQSSDDLLQQYGEARIYWGWKYGLEPTRFAQWEARKLGSEIADLERAVFSGIGTLWSKSEAGFEALPALTSKREGGRKAGPRDLTDGSAEKQYDVALSFAGEQRNFVEAVAEGLRDAGLSVFYDGFEQLWGKDLSLELERVYRRASRYVVVFVSEEYVAKAWPNEERQHALSGRIERMDNSVLPARFNAVELPGLPSTVAYVDIGEQTPADLAALIRQRLADDDA